MTMAMRRYAIILAALLITGCFHEVHEFRPSEYGDVPVGYIAPALQWGQADDAATVIHNLTISVGGTGATFTKSFSSVEEASSELVQLPVGEYDILVTANMTEADGFILTGLPPTKADAAMGSVKVSLKNPASSPSQAWYGVTHASVQQDAITLVNPVLHRLLSTLNVDIANLPAGTTMAMTLSDVAGKVDLTTKDAGGIYGLPAGESVGDLALPAGPFNTLPTVSGKDRCKLTLDITPPGGTPLTVECDAPRIDLGKVCTLNLDFNTLKPYMYISTVTISPWEDGWTVNGEILNPQN